MFKPVNGVAEVTEDSDDESDNVESCSTNSLDTVITNCSESESDDEESSFEPQKSSAEALQNGPQFHDFIDSMVKNAINSHIKSVKNSENETGQNPEIEVKIHLKCSFLSIVKSLQSENDEDTISLSSNASTIVENGFDQLAVADDLLEEEAIKEVELLDQLLDAEEQIEQKQIDRSASPLSVDDDVSTGYFQFR